MVLSNIFNQQRNRLTIIFYMVLLLVTLDMISGERLVADLPHGCSPGAGTKLTTARGKVAREVCIIRSVEDDVNSSIFYLGPLSPDGRPSRIKFDINNFKYKKSWNSSVRYNYFGRKEFQRDKYTFRWQLGGFGVFKNVTHLPGVGRFLNITLPSEGSVTVHGSTPQVVPLPRVLLSGTSFNSDSSSYPDKTEVEGGSSATVNGVTASFNYFLSIRQSPDGDGSWLYRSYLKYTVKTPSFSAYHTYIFFNATIPEPALPS